MSTTSDIRSAIVTLLLSIPDIGQVHHYERFAKAESKLRELYESEQRIQGWLVRRASFKKTELATALYTMRNSWEVRGYMSLQDDTASELIFDALAELVQIKLSNDPSFGGVASFVSDYEMRANFEPVMFCGVLCHSVTLNFDSVHEETAAIEQALEEFLRLYSQYDIPNFESQAEIEKWQQEPSNHTLSKPDLIDNLNLQE